VGHLEGEERGSEERGREMVNVLEGTLVALASGAPAGSLEVPCLTRRSVRGRGGERVRERGKG